MKPIVVINPNSTVAVTEAMSVSLDPLRVPDGPEIVCLTNEKGPPGIEWQAHVDDVSRDIRQIISEWKGKASAFVIACYSDPGLFAARDAADVPVFGIAQCSVLNALTLGSKVGIIAILQRSVERHYRYFRSIGLANHVIADRPIDLRVVELSDETKTFERLVEVGSVLRDQDGADVVVLGCAGMARYRARLQEALGVPVVDPTQAAVIQAIGATRLAG